MNLKRIDIALLITAVALVLPLTFSWLMHLSPLLALGGVVLGAGVVILRTSQSLAQSYSTEQQQQAIPVSRPFQGERVMNVQQRQYAGIGGPVVPPKSGLTKWIQDQFGALWESKHHGLILLCAAAYVVWPIDILPDLVPVGGWLDDIVALILGGKHLFAMFKGEVAGAHASMQGAIERAKQREAIAANEVIDAEVCDDVIEGEFTVVSDRQPRP